MWRRDGRMCYVTDREWPEVADAVALVVDAVAAAAAVVGSKQRANSERYREQEEEKKR